MRDVMRALSIRQPYAELILRALKTVEYRSLTDARDRGAVLHLCQQGMGAWGPRRLSDSCISRPENQEMLSDKNRWNPPNLFPPPS
jgi:hypothetical protein